MGQRPPKGSGAMSESYEALIMGLEAFRGYTEHGARRILDAGEVQEHEPGEVLFQEGDPPESVLLVLRGKTEVFVHRDEEDMSLIHRHTVASQILAGALSVDLSGYWDYANHWKRAHVYVVTLKDRGEGQPPQLWGWGHNDWGQLHPDLQSSCDPAYRLGDVDQATVPYTGGGAVACGPGHRIQLQGPHQFWASGSNGHGQLGDPLPYDSRNLSPDEPDRYAFVVAAGTLYSTFIRAWDGGT